MQLQRVRRKRHVEEGSAEEIRKLVEQYPLSSSSCCTFCILRLYLNALFLGGKWALPETFRRIACLPSSATSWRSSDWRIHLYKEAWGALSVAGMRCLEGLYNSSLNKNASDPAVVKCVNIP